MPRNADALPIKTILPARRSIIEGSTAANSGGKGSTMWENAERHSSWVTSVTGVLGAGIARLAMRKSMLPALAIIVSIAS